MTVLDTGFLQSDWADAAGGGPIFQAGSANVHGGFMHSFLALDGGAPSDAARLTFGAARAGSSDFWTHFRCEAVQNATQDKPLVIFRNGGTELFRIIVINSSEDWAVEYWNGSSWTQVGADITTKPMIDVQIDIHINMDDSTGVYDVYIDKILERSLAGGDTIFTAAADLDDVEFHAVSTSIASDTKVSDFLTADVQTTEYVLTEKITASGGTRQEWAGAESDIDDDGLWDHVAADNNWIAGDAADERATYNMALQDAIFDTNHDVIGVYETYRARKTSTSAGLKSQAAAYISAADYTGGSGITLTNEFLDYQHLWAVDPSTASAWANAAAVEAAEFGLKAVI